MLSGESLVEVVWLGQMEYRAAWELQNELAAQIAAGSRPQTLLLLEHPHVFTIGRRGGYDHLIWDAVERALHGVDLVEVDRGGDITYHGPGQLVGYPLLRLAEPGWQGERLPQADFVGYIRRLEAVLIRALSGFGIPAMRREGLTGVWVPGDSLDGRPGLSARDSKIASIGVKVDRLGISRHGFALNVQPQMDYWQGIVACGLDGVQMISMADLLEEVPAMPAVVEPVTREFGEIFGVHVVFTHP